jgi:hypothetical protein
MFPLRVSNEPWQFVKSADNSEKLGDVTQNVWRTEEEKRTISFFKKLPAYNLGVIQSHDP